MNLCLNCFAGVGVPGAFQGGILPGQGACPIDF